MNINPTNVPRKRTGMVVKITCKRCHHAYDKERSQYVMYKGAYHWLCEWCAAEAERDGELEDPRNW